MPPSLPALPRMNRKHSGFIPHQSSHLHLVLFFSVCVGGVGGVPAIVPQCRGAMQTPADISFLKKIELVCFDVQDRPNHGSAIRMVKQLKNRKQGVTDADADTL